MSFAYSWSVPIEKLMFWRANAWIKYEAKSSMLYLRIHADQLLLTADNKVLETLNMQCKMKGVYKGDVIILIVNDVSQNIRKLKFQIKSNPAQCFQKLGEHFPVIHHNSNNSENTNIRFRNVKDVLKAALESEGEGDRSVRVASSPKHPISSTIINENNYLLARSI